MGVLVAYYVLHYGGLVVLVLSAVAFVDAARRPAAAWEAAEQVKPLWLILLGLALLSPISLLCLVAAIVGLIGYLSTVRPMLRAAERGGR